MMQERFRTLPSRWCVAVLLALACAPLATVTPQKAPCQPAPAAARAVAKTPAPSDPAALPATRRPPTVLGPVADARAGFVANRAHPQNPISDVVVAAFSNPASAAAFVASSFVARETPPIFEQRLARGQSVRFADAAPPFGAAFLVIYYFDERGRPTLLSLLKAHPDIPLAIGTVGYQLLLDVDRQEASPEPPLDNYR